MSDITPQQPDSSQSEPVDESANESANETVQEDAASVELAESIESVQSTEGGDAAEEPSAPAGSVEHGAGSQDVPGDEQSTADPLSQDQADPTRPSPQEPVVAAGIISHTDQDPSAGEQVAEQTPAPRPTLVNDSPAQTPGEFGSSQNPSTTDEPALESSDEPVMESSDEPAVESSDESVAAPRPSAPKPGPVPSPAMLARTHPRPAAPTVPTITTDHSASAAFGRVDDGGIVWVRTGEDEQEKEVGSYPDATPDQALTYFAKKYDDLAASADLLVARAQAPEVASKDIAEGLKSLRTQVSETAMVGDLPALEAKLEQIHAAVKAKRESENTAREAARAEATTERERIVAEAEKIAAQPEQKIQWKQSGARMRELLDEWRAHQKGSVRLDKETENALWTRFSAARNGFDKGRRQWFAGLDAQHNEAKSTKERLVAEAEALSTSKDWAATAGAYKRLMDQWRQAGRASRSDDDALWARFKAAQDAFFNAKDEVVAAEEESFRGNLEVKEGLLKEAEALLPVKDLERTKAALRQIQDKWEAAGKVPRADVSRVEGAMRKVETAVREAEDRKWKSSNPELAARSSSFVEQLERAVADLTADLEKAQAGGDAKRIKKAQEALDARQAWLAQARAGAAEFGG